LEKFRPDPRSPRDKGLIDDPAGKVKSVAFTNEGLARATVMFAAMFEA
jgi:hypothetical protein